MRRFIAGRDDLGKLRDQIAQAQHDADRADDQLEVAVVVEAELASLVADEYCGTAEIGQYDRRRHEIATRKAEATEAKHRAELAVRGLSRRAVDAIEQAGREREAVIADRIASGQARLDQLRSEAAEVERAIEADQEALHVVRAETAKAVREFLRDADPGAATKAASEERRIGELVHWHAKHAPTKPSTWPPELRWAIEAEVARLTAKAEADRRRLREESEQNLTEAGVSERDRAWARSGRPINR